MRQFEFAVASISGMSTVDSIHIATSLAAASVWSPRSDVTEVAWKAAVLTAEPARWPRPSETYNDEAFY